MINKKLVKKGVAAALALAIAVPALTPTAAAAKEDIKMKPLNSMEWKLQQQLMKWYKHIQKQRLT